MHDDHALQLWHRTLLNQIVRTATPWDASHHVAVRQSACSSRPLLRSRHRYAADPAADPAVATAAATRSAVIR